jgi:hypothetical protein
VNQQTSRATCGYQAGLAGFCEIWCETSAEHPSPSEVSNHKQQEARSFPVYASMIATRPRILPALTHSFVTAAPFSGKSINYYIWRKLQEPMLRMLPFS